MATCYLCKKKMQRLRGKQRFTHAHCLQEMAYELKMIKQSTSSLQLENMTGIRKYDRLVISDNDVTLVNYITDDIILT